MDPEWEYSDKNYIKVLFMAALFLLMGMTGFVTYLLWRPQNRLGQR
jgi:preprotein translocase subunit Sss1